MPRTDGLKREIERLRGELAQCRERSALLQTLLDNVPVMITWYNASGRMKYVNRTFEKKVGWSEEEAPHIDLMAECFPDPVYRQRAWAYMQRAVAEWPDFRLRTRSGAYLDTAWANVRLADGSQIGVGIDIGERKHVEAIQRTAEHRLRLITDALPVLITYIDADERYRFNNAAYEAWFGISPGQIYGRTVREVLGESYYAAIKNDLHRALAGKTGRFKGVVPVKDGGTKDIETTYVPHTDESGRVLGAFFLVQDVSELSARKRSEEALRRTSVYTRSLIEASLDPVAVINPQGKVTDINAATAAITGVSREELLGTDFANYFSEPGQARAGYEQAYREGWVRDYPLEIRHRDGHLTPVLCNASVFRDETGAVVGVFASARDISQRKKAEEEVLRLSRWNKLLLDSVGEGIYGVDKDGCCTFINPVALHMLGFSAREIIGKSAHALFHHTRADGSPYPEAECPVHASRSRGKAHRGDDEVYWRKDGSSFPAEFVTTPVREGRRLVGAVVAFVDTTERRRAEAALRLANRELEQALAELRTTQRQMIQSEKLAAIGTLAAGVAHELNNPLTGLLTFIKYAITHTTDRAQVNTVLHDADTAARRMGRIVHDLLAVAAGERQTARHEVLRGASAVIAAKRVLSLLSYRITKGTIEMNCELPEDLPAVAMNADPLQQVLLNLLTNAIDAVEQAPQKRIDISGKAQDGMVEITVADSGSGIPDEIQGRIMDPFFTTKEVGKGSGLGLWIVSNLLHEYSGSIRFWSRAGEGSRFTVSLPAHKGEEP